jgi:hypothetical protein
LLILYLGKEMPDSQDIHQKMTGLLEKFIKKIATDEKID